MGPIISIYIRLSIYFPRYTLIQQRLGSCLVRTSSRPCWCHLVVQVKEAKRPRGMPQRAKGLSRPTKGIGALTPSMQHRVAAFLPLADRTSMRLVARWSANDYLANFEGIRLRYERP